MRILFLAPHPVYQERGSPIAVKLVLQVLSRGHQVDLLCYHEGEPLSMPGLTIYRIPALPGLSGVRPGISCKKLFCDLLFFFSLTRLLVKNRYDFVHAVEESAAMAAVLKPVFGVPYIYDMDSSVAMQLVERWHLLKPLTPLLDWIERQIMRQSIGVLAVCDSLGARATAAGVGRVGIVRDISLLPREAPEPAGLRAELGIPTQAPVVLYVGNLEGYQGIDLLLESFARIASEVPDAHLVIIGGGPQRVGYERWVASRGLAGRIYLPGPRPSSDLGRYLVEADILASPRIKGDNTPMKVYSYLHSGVPVVATRLPTHEQVMDDTVACLASPNPQDYGAALLQLLRSAPLRKEIGDRARAYAEARYTWPVFEAGIKNFYESLHPVQGVGDLTEARRVSGT